MRVTLPYPPSANRYWRVWRGRAVKSKEAREYQEAARETLPKEPATGPVIVTLRVFRPARRGDLDNSIKVVLDALKGAAFDDDGQVVELHAYRYDDKRRPRVEVWVSPPYEPEPEPEFDASDYERPRK